MQLATLPCIFGKQIFIHSHNKMLIYLLSASLLRAGSPFAPHHSYCAKIISQPSVSLFSRHFFPSLKQLRIRKFRGKWPILYKFPLTTGINQVRSLNPFKTPWNTSKPTHFSSDTEVLWPPSRHLMVGWEALKTWIFPTK